MTLEHLLAIAVILGAIVFLVIGAWLGPPWPNREEVQ